MTRREVGERARIVLVVCSAQALLAVSVERARRIPSMESAEKQRSIEARRDPPRAMLSEGSPVEYSSMVSLMMFSRSARGRESGKSSSARRASRSGRELEWR